MLFSAFSAFSVFSAWPGFGVHAADVGVQEAVVVEVQAAVVGVVGVVAVVAAVVAGLVHLGASVHLGVSASGFLVHVGGSVQPGSSASRSQKGTSSPSA